MHRKMIMKSITPFLFKFKTPFFLPKFIFFLLTNHFLFYKADIYFNHFLFPSQNQTKFYLSISENFSFSLSIVKSNPKKSPSTIGAAKIHSLHNG